MKFGLKWVHTARYELILRLDGALWLTIIFKTLLTPKWLYKFKNDPKIMPEILSIYNIDGKRMKVCLKCHALQHNAFANDA